MLCIIAWHVLIISNRGAKCKRSLNKNKIGVYLTKVRTGRDSDPMPPKIQEGEVGSYTLGVAHSIRSPGVYITPWYIFLFLSFKSIPCQFFPDVRVISFLWCFYGGLSFAFLNSAF